jgi:DNA-binding Xre family transcriptional regulator
MHVRDTMSNNAPLSRAILQDDGVSNFAYNSRMAKEREIIVVAVQRIMEATGLSSSGLAKKAGIAASTLTRFLYRDPDYILSQKTLNAICRVAGYDSYEAYIKSSDKPSPKVPIVGTVGAGGEVFPIDHLPLLPSNLDPAEEDYVNCEWADAPPGIYPNGIVAVRVTGNSMMPYMPEGTVVYYAQRFEDGAPDHCLASLCVVQLRDGKTLLKMVRKGQLHGRFDLQSYNMETITDVELAWCAPVIFIKPFLGRSL